MSKKKKKKTSGRAGLWSVTIIAFVMIVAVGYRCVELYNKNLTYEATISEKEEELVEEQNRTEEISDYEASVGTDEYTEKIAREKLGLVYSDETIYREEGRD